MLVYISIVRLRVVCSLPNCLMVIILYFSTMLQAALIMYCYRSRVHQVNMCLLRATLNGSSLPRMEGGTSPHRGSLWRLKYFAGDLVKYTYQTNWRSLPIFTESESLVISTDLIHTDF